MIYPWRPAALFLHSLFVDASLLSDTVWTDAPLIVVGLSLSLGLCNQLSPWLQIELWPLSTSGEASALAGISLSSILLNFLSLSALTPPPPPPSHTHILSRFLAVLLPAGSSFCPPSLLLSSTSFSLYRQQKRERKKREGEKIREEERGKREHVSSSGGSRTASSLIIFLG